MGKPEGKIEDYLLNQAANFDAMCIKFTSPGTSGVPDRVIMAPPNKTVFVEVKAPNGHLRALQKVIIKKMIAHGAAVFVTHTKSAVDEFYRFLSENDYDSICHRDNIPAIIKPETYF